MADTTDHCAEVGTYRGVKIEIRMVDSVRAEVDLSAACLFTHQIDHKSLVGGLADLDNALGGRLSQVRADGAFRGLPMETLVIDKAPSTVKAPAILVVGMGEPEDWSADQSAAAVACALRVGAALGVGSMGFAPSVLDTGIQPLREYNSLMLKGLKTEIDGLHHVYELGLTQAPPSVKRWVFGAGAHGYDQKVKDYQTAFANLMATRA